jgi:hypothetical protein
MGSGGGGGGDHTRSTPPVPKAAAPASPGKHGIGCGCGSGGGGGGGCTQLMPQGRSEAESANPRRYGIGGRGGTQAMAPVPKEVAKASATP